MQASVCAQSEHDDDVAMLSHDAKAVLVAPAAHETLLAASRAHKPSTKHTWKLLMLIIILAVSGLLAVWSVEHASGLQGLSNRSPLHLQVADPEASNSKALFHRSFATSSGGLSGALWARGLWGSYNRALTTKPLATKIFTGIAGTILGDGIAQYSVYRLSQPSTHTWTTPGVVVRYESARLPFRYDVPRLVRLLVWSASAGTPLAHYWFNFLDKSIMPHTPTHPLAVAVKLVLDQGVMAPIGTALFFVSMKALEGQPHLAAHEVRIKLWPVMRANWLVWPLANAINFAVVPPSQRILYVNILSVAWSAFMSHVASSPAQRPPHSHPHSDIQLSPTAKMS